MIAIDTIAVENEVADNMYQLSEFDYLTPKVILGVLFLQLIFEYFCESIDYSLV